MVRYRFLITPIIIIILGIIIWPSSILFSTVAAMFLGSETSSEFSTIISKHEKTIGLNESDENTDISTDNDKASYYESIQETIARIKRDVVVTGTITGITGKESAMFQIEGMADRQFGIGTLLMDGFIIKGISPSNVVLKNQDGNEAFTLHIQSGKVIVSSPPLEYPEITAGKASQQYTYVDISDAEINPNDLVVP